MKVGIVEICEPNHYTAVLALAQTYLVDPLNEVIIFTTEAIHPLLTDLGGKAKILTISNGQSIKEFLAYVSAYPLDRIHINTISKCYKEFAYTQWPDNVYFTVHNIDIWYDNSFLKRSRTLISDYQILLSSPHKSELKLPSILFIKDFWRQYFRNRFIKKIGKRNYRILVYSQSQKKHLEKYVSADKIITFPFCLHNELKDLSQENQKLRITIPGSVSNQRRNYTALLEMLDKHFAEIKQQFSIDLLGYIPDDSRFLIAPIEELKAKGFEIIYNRGFINTPEFDERLSRADLILGNLKVQMNVFRKYGETKETGIIFNIIKAGKPGIMPYGYPVDEEIKDICLFFKNDVDLASMLINLITSPNTLISLKEKSRIAVQQYRPENLYHLLQA